MQVNRVFPARIHAHLADCFQKRQALNVAYRAADFNDNDLCPALPRHQPHAALHLIGYVGDHLDGTAEIVPSPLLGNHFSVHLARGHVAGTCQAFVDEPLIVSQVQVCLCTVIQYKYLAVLIGRHGAGIYVQIRIQFLDRYLDASALEDAPHGGSGYALADR